MFRIFRKKSNRENKHPKMEKAAEFLARNILDKQTRTANWLSRHEQRLSIKQKKFALLIFCACMSFVAGSLLYRGIFRARSSIPDWLQQQSITVPKTHPIPDSLDLNVLPELQNNPNIQTDSTNK